MDLLLIPIKWKKLIFLYLVLVFINQNADAAEDIHFVAFSSFVISCQYDNQTEMSPLLSSDSDHGGTVGQSRPSL